MYYTKITTNDEKALKKLGQALAPIWDIVIENNVALLRYKTIDTLNGEELYIRFIDCLTDIKNSSKLIKGSAVTVELTADCCCYFVNPANSVTEKIDFKLTSSVSSAVLVGMKGKLLAVGGRLDESPEQREEYLLNIRTEKAYNRLVAFRTSKHYQMSRLDWDNQGIPDIRSIYVYVENMFADISPKEFKKRSPELSKVWETFKQAAEKIEIFGSEARHGAGWRCSEENVKKKSKETLQEMGNEISGLKAQMDKKKALEMAQKIMDFWEEVLVEMHTNRMQQKII